jgi:hypothetical protein
MFYTIARCLRGALVICHPEVGLVQLFATLGRAGQVAKIDGKVANKHEHAYRCPSPH